MTQDDFNSLARELFSRVIGRFGFTDEGSRYSVFHRRVGEDIYHLVVPTLGRSGTWYYVRVFPHSPHIDPCFQAGFPDRLGVPTDSWSCLSEHDGVNLTQQRFNCKNEENLRRRFAATVEPLLKKVAIPYLDRFQTVEDLIPAIRHASYLGFALHHVGRHAEARIALERERERLKRLDVTNEDVASLLGDVERLLNRLKPESAASND